MNLEALTTALPNLHPIAVHFPIALFITAVLFDFGCLVFRSQLWLDRAATALGLTGAIGLGLAYLTGERAAEAAAPVTGVAQGVLADHQDLALLTLWAWGIAVALRLLVAWLGRWDLQVQVGIFRLTALVIALAATALLVFTATQGGALVFQHGIGVG